MEKFYIINNQSYLDKLNEIQEIHKKRNEFIKKFFEEKDIEGGEYILHGSGSVGCPFFERDKKDISLYISDTKRNNEKYGAYFCKDSIEGLRRLKKLSKLLKDLQDRCIQEKVIINVPHVRIGDKFKELELKAHSYIQFKHDGNLYLRISNNDVSSITPKDEGFIEIKGSEFYKAKEEYESNK